MSDVFSDPHLLRLKEKFEGTPDTIILKADVLREGVRYTGELREIGQWSTCTDTFLGREEAPELALDGESLQLPNQFILVDDTRVNIELDRASPYTIRGDGSGGFLLFRYEQPVTTVGFPRRTVFARTLSDGAPIAPSLNQRSEVCSAILHSLFCEYAKRGEPCAFCSIGNTLKGLSLSDLGGAGPLESNKSIEACRLAAEEMRLVHIVVSGGAFINTAAEAKSYARTISALRKGVGPKTRITAVCQAFDERGWLRLKEAGADRVQPNLEVWDERLWPGIILGKHRAVGRSEWMERLKTAVDIFGVGEVATNFVAGVEMLPPHGFRDSSEALRSNIEGFASLLEMNIVPVFGFLTKAKGTLYEKAELPTTDYYLSLGWERTMLMKQYGMYRRYRGGMDADFSCYKCVTHKTGQDYPRVLKLNASPRTDEQPAPDAQEPIGS